MFGKEVEKQEYKTTEGRDEKKKKKGWKEKEEERDERREDKKNGRIKEVEVVSS